MVPTTVSITPAARLNAIFVCIARRSFSCSLAPKYRDISTPAPTAMPSKRLTSRNTSVPVALTAASATLPSIRPTISASAVL